MRKFHPLTAALMFVTGIASAATTGNATALVDPMRPLLTPAETVGTGDPAAPAPRRHRLHAIRFETAHRFAIIDGRLVAEGDALGEAKVLKILADEVVIGTDKEIQRLRLTQHVIKKPAVAGTR